MHAFRLMASLVAISGAALATACATSETVERVVDESDSLSSPFNRLLVVGAHPDANTRREFEAALVRAIRATGVDARYSLEFMRSTDTVSRDSIVAAAAQADADAVVITRLVDLNTRTEIEGGRSSFDAERRNSIPLADFFRYEYAEYTDPLVARAVATLVLETDVYRVADERQIWKVQSKAIDQRSVYEAVTTEATSLTRALEADGLIR